MALKLDTPVQFEDLDENQLNQLASQRLQYIGPWIDSLGKVSSRTKKSLNPINKKLKQENAEEKQKLEFLSTLQRQIQFKRTRFRTMVQKAQTPEKQHIIQFKELQNLSKKFAKRNNGQENKEEDIFEKYEKQFEEKHEGLNKNKKALSTTMYVYEYEKPRKTSRLSKNSKAISFSHDSNKYGEQTSLERGLKQVHNGSKNLQRILKMKQRIRVKNHYLVTKIKQKQMQSDKESTKKYLSQLHTMKNWKSITLTTQKSNQKIQMNRHRHHHPHSNFKLIQMDPTLCLKRTITSKYFDS